MKTIAALFVFLATVSYSLAQGLATFANTSSTLISVDGVPMPPRSSMGTTYYFALFLASPDTVSGPGQNASFTDPSFQIVGDYNTNSTSTPGRIVTLGNIDVGSAGGWVQGSTVDFIVRGWSANAGSTWTEALAYWNNGLPLAPMSIGSSTIGDGMILDGGGFPPPVVFGTFGPDQVLGFDMTFVPEPSALALAVLGGAALWVTAQRRKRQPK